VAFSAFALLGTRIKLSLVGIGLVTVHTIRKLHGPLEIAADVALYAADFGMHAEQRVFCLRMIKFESRQYLLPTRGGMAVFAALLERPLMRIDMACRAGFELHVSVAGGSPRLVRLVAFLASHLDMQAGQRISSFRMIKLRSLFPVTHVVATLAVVSELPFVRIGVAGQAIRRQSEK